MFKLYDSRTDITGDASEDVYKQITTLDSTSFPQYFLIEEELQTVTVIVPWSTVNNYEENFMGDTHGVLKGEMPSAAQSQTFADYFEEAAATVTTPNNKGYTTPQLNQLKANITNQLNKVVADGLAEAERYAEAGREGGHDGSSCWSWAPTHHICTPTDDPGNLRWVTWLPWRVTVNTDTCDSNTLSLRLHMAGVGGTQCPNGASDLDELVSAQIRVYDTQQAEQGSPLTVYGWSQDHIEQRNPVLTQIEELKVHYDGNIVYRSLDFEVPVRGTSAKVPAPIFLTLDVGGPGAQCRSLPGTLCGCRCRLFFGASLSASTYEQAWKVPSCEAYALQEFTRAGDAPADCEGVYHTDVLCNTGVGDPFQDNDVIFRNYLNVEYGYSKPLNRHNRILGNDNKNYEPERPAIYTTEKLRTVGAAPWQSSPYLVCGVSYNIWLRFEEITDEVPD